MNKYRQALDNIGEYFEKELEWDLMPNVVVLTELVNRATPKKPIITKTDIHCKCGNLLGDNNGWTQAIVKYCWNCGQAIDWTKNE